MAPMEHLASTAVFCFSLHFRRGGGKPSCATGCCSKWAWKAHPGFFALGRGRDEQINLFFISLSFPNLNSIPHMSTWGLSGFLFFSLHHQISVHFSEYAHLYLQFCLKYTSLQIVFPQHNAFSCYFWYCMHFTIVYALLYTSVGWRTSNFKRNGGLDRRTDSCAMLCILFWKLN